MSEQPTVNIMVDFVDAKDRKWIAAGWLGPLVRHEDGQQVESLLPGMTEDKEMRITGLRVVKEA